MEQQKSILFVYPHASPLDATGSGGQNRIHNLIQEVKKSNQVKVVAPKSTVNERNACNFSGFVQYTSGFTADIDLGLARVLYNEIRQWTPDVIHIPYPSGIVLSRVISVINRCCSNIILDAHDVMSERAIQFPNENLSFTASKLRKYYSPALESLATRIADHIITVSKKDQKLMTKLNNVPPEKQTVIPNGAHPVDPDTLENEKTIRDEFGLSPDCTAVVFHGNCITGTHNLEAAEHICQELAPKFRDDVKFILIGKGMPQSDQDNIATLGFVDDLYSTLYAMDIAVAPLLSGTATKLKMFDYMSVKLPIISTNKGTEGIDLENQKDVITSELGDEFETALKRLIRDPSLQERLGESGRHLIESKYNWEHIGKKLDNVYETL
jgi:glycosyltransferase involved in cell wall biosynthesis